MVQMYRGDYYNHDHEVEVDTQFVERMSVALLMMMMMMMMIIDCMLLLLFSLLLLYAQHCKRWKNKLQSAVTW